MKTHFVTCNTKNAITIRHAILGEVDLACGRRPAYFKRKRLPKCLPCLRASVVESGTSPPEAATTDDRAALQTYEVSVKDLKLVGSTWQDRVDGTTFVLLAVEWTAVDSDDGMKVPVLIGRYKDANASETSTEE